MVTGERRKLYDKELYDVYSSPNIIRMTKSEAWEVHVARRGTGKTHSGFWVGKPEGKNYLEDLGVEGRIILKWIFKNLDEGMDWIELALVRDRQRVLLNAVMILRDP